MNVDKPFSPFVHTAYDAVWSIALTLKYAKEMWQQEVNERKRKKLNLFDYNRTDLAVDFMKQFQKLQFQGISVSIIIL
jgi:hypothetical protein